VHPPASQSRDKVVVPTQEASPSASQPTISKKGKREACLKTSDEPMKATPTSQQVDEGFSHILGGGKHMFPFAQNTYSKRTKTLAKPKVFMEDQQPETIGEFVDLVHPKEHTPYIIPPSSSSTEDDASTYKILVRKKNTRPRNKFRLKSKAVYNPAIKEKVNIIDVESVNPEEKPSTSNKIPITKLERNKYKKGGLTVNKKTPTGKDRVATRKQGKKNKKGPNPGIRSEGDKPTRMQTRSQSQHTRMNSLNLLAEAVTSFFQGDLSV
jgi:hypothetical protein